ncbi:MAG: hypothetical protein HOK17_03055, partial [Flammeovirgaceae bacterium]|nr:hypothetical protein [Flammeovirgaceae bacterium]
SLFADPTADTVIIEFEDETQIIIYAETRAQLKQLNDYNINQIVSDLNNAVGGKELPDYYHITNNSGNRYLKDSTFIYESGKDFKIRMGNVTIEIDGLKEDQSLEDKWYDLADEFSNWHFEGGQQYHYDSINGFTRTSRTYYKKKPWITDLKRYSYEEDQDRGTLHDYNIEMGLNNWLDKGGSLNGLAEDRYSVKPWGSWYFGLASVNKTHLKNSLFLEWGAGLSWYNWKLEAPSYQITKATTEVKFAQPVNIREIDPIKSKLVASYLNVSLVPLFDFAQGTRKVIVNEAGSFKWNRSKKIGFRIGVGGYLGYRMYGRSKYVYKEDNKLRNKEKDKGNFYLSNVRYGLRGRVGWKGMDLFVNYDLNQVFTSGNGPELNAFSFGIIL